MRTLKFHGIFFVVSSDGPNINKSIYAQLNGKLKERGRKALLPFQPCTLHVVHNGFNKGILALNEDVSQLSFDLHSWFKNQPCNDEDFRSLVESTKLANEFLFLDVSTRWLTLSASLKIKKDSVEVGGCKEIFFSLSSRKR